ncbi:DUF6812 domain-containing protein [Paracoccus liaowanqingii]|uniref:DUF6812 domain-containing protein n=1 Tax=Paracoccus liaowanqingii TaxID=2560053 RepID=UPI0034DFEC0C
MFRLPVQIHLAGESDVVLGVVHVRQDQRVLDMLCDARLFFPVETREGVILINKNTVTKIALATRNNIEKIPDAYPQVDLNALDRRSGEMRELE